MTSYNDVLFVIATVQTFLGPHREVRFIPHLETGTLGG
jgi:hypothetical protein